ncbi:hypothetical protein ACFLVN_02475 [Chloroflexota bacterium]
MSKGYIPGIWEARLEDSTWKVFDKDGQLVATLAEGSEAEARAKLIALNPYMREALKGVVELIGDEDLPDNGELSGAAISDMVRSAIDLAAK